MAAWCVQTQTMRVLWRSTWRQLLRPRFQKTLRFASVHWIVSGSVWMHQYCDRKCRKELLVAGNGCWYLFQTGLLCAWKNAYEVKEKLNRDIVKWRRYSRIVCYIIYVRSLLFWRTLLSVCMWTFCLRVFVVADYTAAVCDATARHEGYHWDSTLSCWFQPIQNSSCKTCHLIQDVANSGLQCIRCFQYA